MEQTLFPLDRLEEIKNNPKQFRLLKRVPISRTDFLDQLPKEIIPKKTNEKTCSIIFLDIETTGLNVNTDRIIELSMVKCTYSPSRRLILSVDRVYDGFEDPQIDIPPHITELTHITNDMVRGQKLDEETIFSFMADFPLIVAHYAAFDRPFFDRRFFTLAQAPWACSYNEVEWHKLGDSTKKLEYLVTRRGYFYEAHSSLQDCLALCFLMQIEPTAFAMLLKNSAKYCYTVEAVGLPFHLKDTLKAANYLFNGHKKLWYINVSNKQEVNNQLAFLEKICENAAEDAIVTLETACERYRG